MVLITKHIQLGKLWYQFKDSELHFTLEVKNLSDDKYNKCKFADIVPNKYKLIIYKIKNSSKFEEFFIAFMYKT